MARAKQPVSINGIEFDALIDESRTLEATVPEYSVESGFSVSDAIILSGCINAQAGAIERAVTAHRKHFSDVHCLLSGGAAPYIAPNLSIPCRIIDNLVLIGLHTSSIRPTY